jgi:inorganic triphosphatase YgiF
LAQRASSDSGRATLPRHELDHTLAPSTSELELKFEVPEEVVAALQAELRRHGAHVVTMSAYYYDTPDFELAAQRVSLRLRREGRRWMQTLKVEGRSAVERLEHNVPVRGSRASPPVLDVDRHNGTHAGSVLREALGDTGLRRLAVRYSTEVERLLCDLQVGETAIEAALDIGHVAVGERTIPIRELELEHKGGPTGALFELAKSWSAFGGLCLSTVSKATRGTRLARNERYGPAVKASRPRVQPDMNGVQFARAVLRATLDQVLANASEIAAGSSDEEHVHQLRVGLRRLRTALRELAPLDAQIDPQWEKPLAEAFRRLGDARDRITAARAVRALLEHAHAPKVQWRETGVVDPVAIVRDTGFQSVLIDLLAHALQEAASDHTTLVPPAMAEQMRARLSNLHDRVEGAGKRFTELEIDQQHKTRKRLKRLRYLAEFFAPLCDGKAVKRYLAGLEPAQDALGEHMDVSVALEQFRKDAETDPQSLFAVGYLEAHRVHTAQHAQSALKEFAKAQPFWN